MIICKGITNNEKINNKNSRRRVFSARIVGDDAFFVDRQGKGSPPFENINLKTGDKLTGREFPIIYKV